MGLGLANPNSNAQLGAQWHNMPTLEAARLLRVRVGVRVRARVRG